MSREAVAAAMRAGDRALATRVAALLTRRKRIIWRANGLGDVLDALAQGKPLPQPAAAAPPPSAS